jgi:hypothetical protein
MSSLVSSLHCRVHVLLPLFDCSLKLQAIVLQACRAQLSACNLLHRMQQKLQ